MNVLIRCYSDDVFLAIKTKIIEGDLDFGSRLHISDLAKEFGVSSTPVREAINRLSTSGLVELKAHKGAFVIDPCERDIRMSCDARLCLELHMADAVILNATSNQIEKLNSYIVQGIYQPIPYGFHDYYAAISGNEILIGFHKKVQELITVLFGKAIRKFNGEKIAANHTEEEKQIVAAIINRDAVLLKEIIGIHLKSIEEVLLAAKVVKLDHL